MAFPPRAPVLVTWYPSGKPEQLPAAAEVQTMRWAVHADNPLITPHPLAAWLAEPTFLPPSETPDGRWHLFARSPLGLHHHVSNDGLRWSRLPALVARGARRAFLFRGEKGYLLASESTVATLPWLPADQRLELRSSIDLIRWTAPRLLLQAGLPWHRDGARQTVGRPCVIRLNDRYRLYYEGGATTGLAESPTLEHPLCAESTPLGERPLGAIRIVPVADGLLGLRLAAHAGADMPGIERLKSTDGRAFEPLGAAPLPLAGARLDRPEFDARWLDGRLLVYYTTGGRRPWSRGGLGLAVLS